MQDFTQATLSEALETSKPVIVDFWAPWCGPCKMLNPVLKKLDAELEGQLVLGKVDISEQKELAEIHNVKATPTFILFRDGVEVNRKVGGIPGSVLRNWAAEAVNA